MAGRRAGGKNKATLERELLAAQAIIDGAKERGAPKLAKDVLERVMGVCEGAAGKLQPVIGDDGKVTKGDIKLFGEWIDRTIFAAKELAKYQSPTFKAVQFSQLPQLQATPPMLEGKVVSQSSEERHQQAMQTYLTLVKVSKAG